MGERENIQALSWPFNGCPPPVFVARDQGKSPPRLHKARVEATRINARHNVDTHSSFQTQVAHSEAVGPMELPTVISLGTSLAPMGSTIPVT